MRYPESGVDFRSQEWDVELYNNAYEKAVSVIRRSSMDRHKFVGLYGAERIQQADAYVADIEEKISRQNNPDDELNARVATVYEAILHEQGSHWLGREVVFLKPDRYDDLMHGIDEVLEWKDIHSRRSHMGLSVDATFSANYGVEKKMGSIADSIRRGELSTISFFESDSFRGELRNVPKVIVGAGKQTLHSLTRLWVKRQDTALKTHPMGWLMYQQLEAQCAGYRDFALRVGRREVADKYDQSLRMVKHLREEAERERRIFKGEDTEADPVYQAIVANLVKLKVMK